MTILLDLTVSPKESGVPSFPTVAWKPFSANSTMARACLYRIQSTDVNSKCGEYGYTPMNPRSGVGRREAGELFPQKHDGVIAIMEPPYTRKGVYAP
jgi:hypothetical protein